MSFGELIPHLNAAFNGLSTVCLLSGWAAVRTGRVPAHKAAMLSAFAFSALFLGFYVTGQFIRGHVAYEGPPALRVVYLVILISHMLLAVPVVPLSITLVVLGLRGRIDRHRRLARWALPVWLYVSVTGVVVYWMLFHLER